MKKQKGKKTKKPIIIHGSYQLKNGRYSPCVLLRFIDGFVIKENKLEWQEEFDTKKEADNYALLQTGLLLKEGTL